jgi:hypothetical protein
MTKAYYRDTIGVMLVYDTGNRGSFDNAQKIWIPQVKAFVNDRVPIVIVANKANEANGVSRAVTTQEGFELAQEYSAAYIEASAAIDHNVNAAFRRLIFTSALMFPDIANVICEDQLPSGWLSLPEDDEGNAQYENYWTGEISGDEPISPAIADSFGTEDDKTDVINVDMTFRESFT